MADQHEETAAAAPPDTPTEHGSEVRELDEHGKALGSSFPELWGVSSPESNNGDNVGDTDEVLSPDTLQNDALTEEAPPEETQRNDKPETPLEAQDSSFQVKSYWKQKEQTTKRSQLLNLNDFHMQQRQDRVGDKVKKGEAAEHLHRFRNNDAPTKPQKDPAPSVKQPASEQTKAADRAAMAQYMFLRQSKESKPAASAPHRTKSLRNPTPELAPSKSGEDSISSTSSSKGAISKWRKSPMTGKNVVVTDVDEFYAQQHAIHLENERKKREILHISDNKEVSADKTSTMPPSGYTKSMIPALVDSTDGEDVNLAMASSSNSTDDSNAEPGEDGAFPRNLNPEFNTNQSDPDTTTELVDQVEDKEGVLGSALLKEEDARNEDVVLDAVACVSEDTQLEADMSQEKASEKNIVVSTRAVVDENSVEVKDQTDSSLNMEQKSSTVDGTDESKGFSFEADAQQEENRDEGSAVQDAIDDIEEHRTETTVGGHEQGGDSTQDAADDGDESKEVIPAKAMSNDNKGVISGEKAAVDEGRFDGNNHSSDEPPKYEGNRALEKSVIEQDAQEAITVEQDTEDGVNEAVRGIQETEAEEVHDSFSKTVKSSTEKPFGDESAVANDQNGTSETDEAHEEAKEKSSDEIGSVGRPRGQQGAEVAEAEKSEGTEDNCGLEEDFVVVYSEDCEGWDSRSISRPTLDDQDSTPGDADVKKEEAKSGPQVEVIPSAEESLCEATGKHIAIELDSEQDETLESSQENIDKAEDRPAIVKDIAESKVSNAVECNLESGAREKLTAEFVDHVPDDISIVSADDDDSTATVDGDTLSDVREADVDLEVAGIAIAMEQPTAGPVDHVPEDVSNVSGDTSDSTATVDGDTPSDVREADVDLEVAAIEIAMEQPTTGPVDHVPGDVSNVSGDTSDSTAAVDGDTPSDVREADIDLEVAAIEMAMEQPTTGPVDHVPGDVSNVSGDMSDSTAAVDGDTASDVREADIDLEMAALGLILDEPTAELVNHVPEDVSNVATDNDDSTATIDGDEAPAVAAVDGATELGNFDGLAQFLNDFSGGQKLELKSWDEGDEFVAGPLSEVAVDLQSSVEDYVEVPRTDDHIRAIDNNEDIAGPDSVVEDTQVALPTRALQEGTAGVQEAGEHIDEEIRRSYEADVIETPATLVDGQGEDVVTEVVLDEYRAPSHEVMEESLPGTVDVTEVNTWVNNKERDSDDEAVLDALLASEYAQESNLTEMSSLPSSAGTNEGDEESELPTPDDIARIDTENGARSQDKVVPLASHYGPPSHPSIEGDNDEDASQEYKMGAIAGSEDQSADADADAVPAAEQHFANSELSGHLPTENGENENSGTQAGESDQANVSQDGSSEPAASEEAVLKTRDVQLEGASAKVAMEETDKEVIEEAYNANADRVKTDCEAESDAELCDVSGIQSASSKDTIDVSPSQAVAALVRAVPSDEIVDEIMPKASSRETSTSGTESSEDSGPLPVSCAPSAGSTDKPAASNPGAKVEVDYKSADYRGFIFVVHKTYGLMLLYCTRKIKKGPHFQLPGGHVDEPEFFAAAEESRDPQTQLLLAARAGAARELYEETGMDVRYQLDRMEPAALRNDVEFDKHGKPILKNELKHRLYFFLPVTNDDFWSSDKGDSDEGKMHPMGAALGCEGSQLMLRLSVEHQGWTFQKDPNKSAQMLAVHSGGQGAVALRMSMARGTSGLEDKKPSPAEKADTEEQMNKELQSETWETEPLVKDEAVSPTSQEIPRTATDLLPPPEASGFMKLFSCCLWFNHEDD